MGVRQGMARNGKSVDQWAQSPTESPYVPTNRDFDAPCKRGGFVLRRD